MYLLLPSRVTLDGYNPVAFACAIGAEHQSPQRDLMVKWDARNRVNREGARETSTPSDNTVSALT